jgi:hypothetical protein
MSGQTYVEFFQQLDPRIVVPIGITGVGGTLLAGICAVSYREQRRVWSLLAAAFALGAIGSLVTIFFNIPINERLATWNPKALPPDYQEYLRQWWQWHHVRLVAMFAAMCLVFCLGGEFFLRPKKAKGRHLRPFANRRRGLPASARPRAVNSLTRSKSSTTQSTRFRRTF